MAQWWESGQREYGRHVEHVLQQIVCTQLHSSEGQHILSNGGRAIPLQLIQPGEPNDNTPTANELDAVFRLPWSIHVRIQNLQNGNGQDLFVMTDTYVDTSHLHMSSLDDAQTVCIRGVLLNERGEPGTSAPPWVPAICMTTWRNPWPDSYLFPLQNLELSSPAMCCQQLCTWVHQASMFLSCMDYSFIVALERALSILIRFAQLYPLSHTGRREYDAPKPCRPRNHHGTVPRKVIHGKL